MSLGHEQGVRYLPFIDPTSPSYPAPPLSPHSSDRPLPTYSFHGLILHPTLSGTVKSYPSEEEENNLYGRRRREQDGRVFRPWTGGRRVGRAGHLGMYEEWGCVDGLSILARVCVGPTRRIR